MALLKSDNKTIEEISHEANE